MLGKLIKHEFRATGRIMLPMLLIVVLLAVLANASFAVIDKVENGFLSMLLGLLIAAFFIGVFAAAIIAVVIMVMRFYRNLLGDQGYLMMTLPTGVDALVWSKLICSMVWFIVTGIVVAAAMAMTVFGLASVDITTEFEQIPSFSQIIDAICRATGATPAGLVGMGVEAVVIVILGSLATCLHFYAAMSIGHSFSQHKVLLSVVFFIVLNIALQIVSFGLAGLVGTGFFEYYSHPTFEMFSYALHFILALIVVEGAGMYFATTLPLKKGLNLA